MTLSLFWRRAALAALLLTSPAAARGPAQGPQPAGKPQPAPTARVFHVPAGVIDVRNQREQERERNGGNPVFHIHAGGSLTVKGASGTYFVDAGGSLNLTAGGSQVVIVKKGGRVAYETGGLVLYREKGAEIRDDGFPLQVSSAYDSVTFVRLKPFALRGTVTGAHGKPAAGVKVHAYGLGKFFLGTATTGADGSYTLRPAREVEYVVADLAPRWEKQDGPVVHVQDLDLRLHVRPLKGWEVVVAEGAWGADARVDLAYAVKAPLTVTERALAPDDRRAVQLNPHFITVAPDGRYLAAMEFSGDVGLWDLTTGKALPAPKGVRSFKDGVRGVAFAPDGALLGLACGDGVVRLYRPTTGELVHALRGHTGHAQCLTFTPDGKAVLTGGADGTVRTWDVATGQEGRRFKAHSTGVSVVTLTPDGKALITGGTIAIQDGNITFHRPDQLRQWDVATGREVRQFTGLNGRMVVSADGQLVVTAGMTETIRRDANVVRMVASEGLSLHSLSSGAELFRRSGIGDRAVFSADGRLLVTTNQGGVVRYWELATGQEVLRVPVPARWLPGAALTAGGDRVVAGGDGLRVYDLAWERVLSVTVPPAGGWEAAWADLAADDGAAAYRAVATLAAGGDKAAAFLRTQLQPAPARDLPLPKLIADLNSDRFAAREAASRALVKIGAEAEAALREALAKDHPLEARRRIEGVLGTLQRQQLPPEELRRLRAVAALERSGSPAARQLLEVLAGGWPAARQTQEARASLQRLPRKPAAP